MAGNDWKGESLIRGVRPTKQQARAEICRVTIGIGKRSGRWPTPEKTKRAHGAFVKSALGVMKSLD